MGRDARLRRQPAGHPGAEGARPRAASRDLRPLLPALLAVRGAARVPGHLLLVRRGDEVPRPNGRAERARSRGSPSTSSTAASASGWPTPATGRSAATGSGVRRSRCGRATIPTTPGSTSTARSPRCEADFGVDRHRSPSARRRRPRAAEPRRSHRSFDDAAGARGPRLLVRVGLDAVRPGPLPVREPGVVRGPLPGRLHRRVHGPDARLVLHAARAGHGAVRPSGVPHLRQPRRRARLRRAEDVQEPAQLPGPDGGLRRPRGRRHALVPAVVADPARQRLLGHRRRAAGHRPAGAAAAVERVVLPRPLRQRRRPPRRSSGTRRTPPPTCSTATCWPRPASSSRS